MKSTAIFCGAPLFGQVLPLVAIAAAFTGVVHSQDDLDWGDAPDPIYPTLAASNGARHFASPSFCLGTAIDIEVDGQPTANADGDDVTGSDDEDGVTWYPMFPGQLSRVEIFVTGSGGRLDAWVDFDGNGSWLDPGEQILASAPASPGANIYQFPVPAGAGVNLTTFARVRLSTQGGLQPDGGPVEGEVEDDVVVIAPHKMHYPQLPDPNGLDVRACPGQEQPEPLRKVLADDFRCTRSGPITHVTFWGSFKDDRYIEGHEYQGITKFHLSIHDDIPDPDGDGPEYSKPAVPALMEWDIDPFDAASGWTVRVQEELPSEQGWYDPNTGEYLIPNHFRYFRYDVWIPANEAFVQQEGKIYWLDISVETEAFDQPIMWGWKTSRSQHFNDDAVWADLPVVDKDQWGELRDPETQESLDLAFVIDGEEVEEEAYDWGDAPDAPYPTLSANNGANHLIVPNFMLGTVIDAEVDGQPSTPADGDDINPVLLNDEDGVTLPAAMPRGSTVTVNVFLTSGAGATGVLDAWLDSNLDGVWSSTALEYVVQGQTLFPGNNAVSFTIPANAALGANYLRFRLTSTGVASPKGSAQDGEVEDYLVTISDPDNGVDFGDAPDGPYPTLAVNNGAAHVIVPGYQLGLLTTDSEADGQPDATATGDNLAGTDDEAAGDGVFVYPLISGQLGAIDVQVAGGAGFVDAWLDFNGDGNWSDPGERLGSGSVAVTPGWNQIAFGVPAGSVTSGSTFLRVRFSSTGGLLPAGPASDGEVEDHEVRIVPEGSMEFDYGDAMDPTYPTLNASLGAAHLAGGPLWLGPAVDPEADGQPTPAADGDDLAGVPDEDGVSIPYPIVAGLTNNVWIDVSGGGPGYVDAWVDLNGNGSWGDPGEQVLVSWPVPGPGMHMVTLPAIPSSSVVSGVTVARFRISSTGGLGVTGFAQDGEVEDHEVEVWDDGAFDWGDAPDAFYHTWMAGNGAAHLIDWTFYLGATPGMSIDADPDGQPNATATGDDADGNDDEDGLTFLTEWISGCDADFDVVASKAGLLQAWIDYDGDGTWNQANENIIASQAIAAGLNSFSVTLPDDIGPHDGYARFRLSSSAVGYDGYGGDGEVEDYLVPIGRRIQSAIAVDLTTSPMTVTLTWTAWGGAGEYCVYSSTDLTGSFPADWTLEASGITATTWSEMPTAVRKFYIVVAFP